MNNLHRDMAPVSAAAWMNLVQELRCVRSSSMPSRGHTKARKVSDQPLVNDSSCQLEPSQGLERKTAEA